MHRQGIRLCLAWTALLCNVRTKVEKEDASPHGASRIAVRATKGCPLISREVGLSLLREYEDRRSGVPGLRHLERRDLEKTMSPEGASSWLRDRLFDKKVGLTDVDQFVFLRAVFPVFLDMISRACTPALPQCCRLV